MFDKLLHWIAGTESNDLTDLVFELNTPPGTLTGAIVIAAVGLAAALIYYKRLKNHRLSRRWLLIALRTLTVMLLLLLLFDPCLVGVRVKPSDQTVALLFDDSSSMRILSDGGRSRGARTIDAYRDNREAFDERLRQRFKVVTYRFGENIERLTDIENLTFNQPVSNISGAIRETVREWEGNNLSAIVLFSDGIQQPLDSSDELDIPNKIPIYTIGTDTDTPWRDLSIDRVSVTRTPFDLSPLVFTANVLASGLQGKEAAVEILQGTRTIKTERAQIVSGDETIPVKLQITPSQRGWADYAIRVRLEGESPVEADPGSQLAFASANDRVLENNARQFVIDNRPKLYRILYISGRPNWEHTFVRRALLEDEQLKLIGLIRISAAERKFEYRGAKTSMTNPLFEGFDEDQVKFGRYDEPIFLRLGVEETELAGGYPTKEEELFPYDLLIFGDVEREFFTLEQLELTREFVAKRGGALLILGGPRAFRQGGFSGSPIESMLPVQLGLPGETPDYEKTQIPFHAAATGDGELTGAWKLDTDLESGQMRWDELPPLFGLNAFTLTRAGATVWAKTVSDDPDLNGLPVFAIQRYGLGRCAIMAVGETWTWRMKSKDHPFAHERVWRQIVRSLVMNSPKSVSLRSKEDVYPAGKPVRLDISIKDDKYDAREGLQTSVTLIAPSGDETPLPVEESIQETGIYSSEFIPASVGTHRVSIHVADGGGKQIGELEEAIAVEPDNREWLQPRYDPDQLKSIAQRTGGEFVPLERMNGLVDRIPWHSTEESERSRIHLWHHPGFFFLLPLLMAAEWLLRRRRGLA